MENFQLKNIQLGEVQLRVNNMYHSLDFYKKVLGLNVLKLGKGYVKLTANGVDSLIVLKEVPYAVVTEPETRIGLYHFALRVPTQKDLGLLMKNLTNQGIQFGQADHLVSEAVYLSDIDNNGIEIYVDRPSEKWNYDANNEVIMTTQPLNVKAILDSVGEESFVGLPTKTEMGHIHLHVGNLERDSRFFTEIMGFKVASSGMAQYGALFLAADSYHHHLGLNVWAGESAPISTAPETGLDYFTLLLPADRIGELLEHLTTNQVVFTKNKDCWFIQTDLGIVIKLNQLNN